MPTRPRALNVVGGALRLVAAVGLLAYPFAMFFALNGRGPRFAALLMLALIAPAAVVRFARRESGSAATIVWIPLITVGLLSMSALLDDAGFALLVPAAVSTVLLAAFGATLVSGTPMVERFARLQHPDLSAPEVAWCRLWTVLWCGFFVANATVSVVLALLASHRVWAIYNGGVAYVLMGLMFAVEWAIRKARFGRPGNPLIDRVLSRVRRDRAELP